MKSKPRGNVTLRKGDGDFRSVVQAVQRRGIHVALASSMRSKPPMVADELRRQADTFLELYDLIDLSVVGQ